MPAGCWGRPYRVASDRLSYCWVVRSWPPAWGQYSCRKGNPILCLSLLMHIIIKIFFYICIHISFIESPNQAVCSHEHHTPACEKLRKKDLSLRPALATEWERPCFQREKLNTYTYWCLYVILFSVPVPHPHHPLAPPVLVPSVSGGGGVHIFLQAHAFTFALEIILQGRVTSMGFVCFILSVLESCPPFSETLPCFLLVLSCLPLPLPVSSVLILSCFAIS